jgi:hypothetical protein
MAFFDVFHGDADGLCSLQQLRLAYPRSATLISGEKRKQALLEGLRVEAGDVATILDIPLDQNRESLQKMLDGGAFVLYFDHHYAGSIPEHENFEAYIDTSPGTCTSLLVDRYLQGRFRSWAIVGSFGDNLSAQASSLAAASGLSSEDIEVLRGLGELLNYNDYGDSITDLHFHPAYLADIMRPYSDPGDFLRSSDVYRKLAEGYKSDIVQAAQIKPEFESDHAVVIVLPDAPWSRRVRGVVANHWVSRAQTRALAVLSPNRHGGFMVSLRAPLRNPVGADALCRQFDGGGGRSSAGGINHLARIDVQRFIALLESHFRDLALVSVEHRTYAGIPI